MTKVLRDIWILTQGGMVIFRRVFNEKVDAQLFGGFMSALETFALQIADKGMSSFEIGDRFFYIHKENNLMFIVNSATTASKKDSLRELENIVKKFFKLYLKTIFEDFNGDISIFGKFKSEIEESLDNPLQRLKELWSI
jgi:hypothetical protein